MEQSIEILKYLPLRFKNLNEQEYIEFLWDSYLLNHEKGKYQFAFIAYHMLFMSFVYVNIWQIKCIRSSDFEKIKLGFNEDFGKASDPFMFSSEGESKIFDLLKYLCVSHSDVATLIGQYKKLVKERNSIAHANGNLPFRTETYFQTRIKDIIRYASEIQSYSKPLVQECLEEFLIASQIQEERQFIDPEEHIDEILIHEHYFSEKDLEFCFQYDIRKLSTQPAFEEIERIFNVLKEKYDQG